jgi:hypothetical protein
MGINNKNIIKPKSKNLPLPLFAKEGNLSPPLTKGDLGGFL